MRGDSGVKPDARVLCRLVNTSTSGWILASPRVWQKLQFMAIIRAVRARALTRRADVKGALGAGERLRADTETAIRSPSGFGLRVPPRRSNPVCRVRSAAGVQ
jgi:hypothetical protein